MSLALLLAALVLTDVVQVWHVLVIAAFRGVFMSLNMPTRQALISDIVGREQLMNAIAVMSMRARPASAARPSSGRVARSRIPPAMSAMQFAASVGSSGSSRVRRSGR